MTPATIRRGARFASPARPTRRGGGRGRGGAPGRGADRPGGHGLRGAQTAAGGRPRSTPPAATASSAAAEGLKGRTRCGASPSGTPALRSWAPMPPPAAWRVPRRLPAHGRAASGDERPRGRGRSVRRGAPGGSKHARALPPHRLRIGGSAPRGGRRRARAPGGSARCHSLGRGRVARRACCALGDSRAGAEYGPGAAGGTARQGMGCWSRRPPAYASSSLQLPGAAHCSR
jgi:hypothetical protein